MNKETIEKVRNAITELADTMKRHGIVIEAIQKFKYKLDEYGSIQLTINMDGMNLETELDEVCSEELMDCLDCWLEPWE